MVFNDYMIFIHIGKTGGMSCSEYLLRNLQPLVYNCHYEATSDLKRLSEVDVVPGSDISRHCTLSEALEYISKRHGRGIENFEKVVAVIRHPYTLEYSFYKHLQKAHARRRKEANNRAYLVELADGDFKTFVAKAGYHRKGHTQDDFFRMDGEIPDCVELVRFENLAVDFPKAVSRFLKKDALYPLPHRNYTRYLTDMRAELTDEVKEMIYRKHRFMFDSGLYSTAVW